MLTFIHVCYVKQTVLENEAKQTSQQIYNLIVQFFKYETNILLISIIYNHHDQYVPS